MSQIEHVHARQILDSRGNPTVEVELSLQSGAWGRAAVPSGASTGEFEATELRDGGSDWLGKGVTKAVDNVNGEIATAVRGQDAGSQAALDRMMIVPVGARTFAQALRMGAEVFHHLKRTLHERGLSTAVGDEGGFAPDFTSNEQALEALINGIRAAGFVPGDQVAIALDPAMSELQHEGAYVLEHEGRTLSADELASYWADLVGRYPIVVIEDGMGEEDWDGWSLLTDQIGSRVQLVGDDVFVTNSQRLKRGID